MLGLFAFLRRAPPRGNAAFQRSTGLIAQPGPNMLLQLRLQAADNSGFAFARFRLSPRSCATLKSWGSRSPSSSRLRRRPAARNRALRDRADATWTDRERACVES